MSYFKFKKRPSNTTDRQKVVKKLDAVFSEYIRVRNCDGEGYCTCITCGDRYHWRDMTCGHYVKRGNMATRYDLQNCGEQCSTCNVANDGMEEQHQNYIEAIYGLGTAEKLERLGREERHFSEHDLQNMMKELVSELKAVKQEKGLI